MAWAGADSVISLSLLYCVVVRVYALHSSSPIMSVSESAFSSPSSHSKSYGPIVCSDIQPCARCALCTSKPAQQRMYCQQYVHMCCQQMPVASCHSYPKQGASLLIVRGTPHLHVCHIQYVQARLKNANSKEKVKGSAHGGEIQCM